MQQQKQNVLVPAKRKQMRSQRHLARKRSEEHTSELQSQSNLVCRLLLEKKKSPSLPCTRPLLLLRESPSAGSTELSSTVSTAATNRYSCRGSVSMHLDPSSEPPRLHPNR